MKKKQTRRMGGALAALVIAASFVGCSFLKKKLAVEEADSAVGTSLAVDAAPVVATTALGAKNESSVGRYGNETPLSNEPAVIGANGATARNVPGSGQDVAFLPKGTPVAKIAQHGGTSTLVMFDNPSHDGSKLIGWVPSTSFDTGAPTPSKIIVPPRVDAGVDAGVVSPKDAGAAIVDAGTKDAGAKLVADAGSNLSKLLPPAPPSGIPAVPPINGKCPDNWALTEGMCRRRCTADAECPRGTKCVTKSGTKVCSSDR